MTQIPQIMWMNMPKVIHSLQLYILHQMRSYSCQDDLTIELYLLFCVYTQLGIRVILGKRVQIPLNQVQSDTKRNSKSSTPYFTSNETLCQCLRSLRVELYLFHRYSDIGAIWETWPKYTKSCLGTHGKQSKVFNSTFHIKLAFTLVSMMSKC